MADTRKVANICSVILDEYLSATQKNLALFKAVSHFSLIEHFNSADFIVRRK